MRKLIEFIRSVYVVALFVALEAVAVGYYARSTCYTQARLLARSNAAAGAVHGFSAGVRRYFSLGTENKALLERVAYLEERLAQYDEAANIARLRKYMTEIGGSKYRVMTATVISNSINRTQNFITINRGYGDGVVPDMAALSPVFFHWTDRYSVAMPVLNTSFRASGKLEGADYFGSVYWDGADPHTVLFGELSKYSEPKLGQEVVTTGFSQFFPEDVLIGRVERVSMNETRTAFTVRVRLAAEFSKLTDVILVENRDANEIIGLEKSEGVEEYIRNE